jgi:hypothetical protein
MSDAQEVDERGIPINYGDLPASPSAPPNPCQVCTGTDSQGRPSWTWCQEMHTCAATVDWDRIYNHY